MAYTVSTVTSRIQRKLDNPSFDAQTILDYLNDYQRELFNKYRMTFMEREVSSLTTSANSTAITGLPTDIQVPLNMRIILPVNYASMLPYIEYEDYYPAVPNTDLLGTGPPSAWTIFNGVPILHAKADVMMYTLAMKYIKTPIELVNTTDVPEIPVDFSELLVLGAYKRCLEHDDSFDLAQIVQLELDDKELAFNDRFRRQHGITHVMRQPNNAGRNIGRI